MALLSMIGSNFTKDPPCHFNHLKSMIKSYAGSSAFGPPCLLQGLPKHKDLY